MAQVVLVIAAHPDDEVLGCGGTLAKLADEGVAIHLTFPADGVSPKGLAPAIPVLTYVGCKTSEAFLLVRCLQ